MKNSLRRMYWSVRRRDRMLQVLADLTILTLAFLVAYLLRFEFHLNSSLWHSIAVQLPMVLLVQVVAAYVMGVYSFIWRFVGLAELQAFVRAGAASALPLLVLRLGLPESASSWRVPLSIIILDTLLAFGGLLGIRVLRRIVFERWSHRAPRNQVRTPVMVMGAGSTGIAIVREIQRRGDSGLQVKGFLDDAPEKRGSVVQGVPVLGCSDDLEDLIRHHEIRQVILAFDAPGRQVRSFMKICADADAQLKVVPPLVEILDGTVEISRLRDVDIEDLLRRAPVVLETKRLEGFLRGRRIMVTGAGGSIGSEIARQASFFSPSSLLLLDRAEYGLFEVHRELTQRPASVAPVALVADVGDRDRMREILSRHRPEVIFHAAAHKHVPLMEANCSEAVFNNVIATHRLGKLADEFEVETFVLISTDKAVRPTSIMGVTKRMAELAILDLDRDSHTRYLAVRFGNVMGSTGSVIPLFREQIAKGGPLTVTHREMRRYFMTIPEASQLVLQAGAMGRGGELFVLDMGEPVRILDLAHDMIRLSGLRPGDDIEILFTGPRPGEKLFEELELDHEHLAATSHPKILVGRLVTGSPDFGEALGGLEELAALGLEADLRRRLAELVPEARLGVGASGRTAASGELPIGEISADRARPTDLN